jgi:hypothetical protein
MPMQPHLLKRLTLHTIIFVFLQCVLVAGHFAQPITQSNMIVEFSNDLFHSLVILEQWGMFITAHCLLYVLFIASNYVLAINLGGAFRLTPRKTEQLGIALWYFLIISLWLLNHYFFPYSLFSFFSYEGANPFSIQLFFWIVTFFFFLLFIIAVHHACRRFPIFTSIAFLIAFIMLMPFKLSHSNHSSHSMPNLIIIGIDSVRYDLLHNAKAKTLLPNLSRFFSDSSDFIQATTPLARTFPAWTSILTGNTPLMTGARHTLIDFPFIHEHNNLVDRLHQLGYYNVLAFDDRRFNPMDERYGFTKIILPKAGFNDFFLGSINDFPIANVVVNSFIGRFLFPFSYGNRAASESYYPSTFNHLLFNTLSARPNKPLFLALHLCLPHWPFTWADSPFIDPKDPLFTYKRYLASIHRADKQFGTILTHLKQQHLLDNAIVVVLSDHGQSFVSPNENLLAAYQQLGKHLPPRLQARLIASEEGHGTNLTDWVQTHIILAMHRYGKLPFKKGPITQESSLIDIAPTLLASLNQTHENMQGITLLPALKGKNLKPRSVMLETGFTLPAILTAKKSIRKILDQGLRYIKLQGSTGKVFVRHLFTPLIVTGKQRAIFQYPWLVITYPINSTQFVSLAVNFATHQWTTDFTQPFIKNSKVPRLYAELRHYYSTEIPSEAFHVNPH